MKGMCHTGDCNQPKHMCYKQKNIQWKVFVVDWYWMQCHIQYITIEFGTNNGLSSPPFKCATTWIIMRASLHWFFGKLMCFLKEGCKYHHSPGHFDDLSAGRSVINPDFVCVVVVDEGGGIWDGSSLIFSPMQCVPDSDPNLMVPEILRQTVCPWAQSYVAHGWHHTCKWSRRPFLNQLRDLPLAAFVQRHPGCTFRDIPGGMWCYRTFWTHTSFCLVCHIY